MPVSLTLGINKENVMTRNQVLLLTCLLIQSTHSLAQPTGLPERRPGVLEQRDREPSRNPGQSDGPIFKRPDSFTKSCDSQLIDAQQMVRNQKERIDLLEYIRRDLETDNAKLKATVSDLEAQVAALRKQISAKKS